MDLARRAAVYAAMQAETVLRSRADDAACLDFLCRLSTECDARAVSDAALAAAGADVDGLIAAAARTCLSERRLRRAANVMAASAQPLSGTVDDSEWVEEVASFAEALIRARERGCTTVQVPRAFLRAVAPAERADAPIDTALADAVWRAAPAMPSPATCLAILRDGSAREQTGSGVTLVPIGCAEFAAPCVTFAGVDGGLFPRSEFFGALGPSGHAVGQPRFSCALSIAEAAGGWLCEGALDVAADAVWPAPEEPALVRAPRMTFSASRLNAYVKCPRRWFFEYLCDCLDELPSPQALYGRVFHAALEALHREVRGLEGRRADAILERLNQALDAAFGAAHADFTSQLEYETARLRARRVAEQYVRWLFVEAAEAPFEITATELRHTGTFGGHDFVGFIDRIDRPAGGGPITIFDYKTGRIEEDPEEYLRRLRSGEEAQLALYYAMRRALGDEVARIALVSVRDARDKTWMLALDIIGEDGNAVLQRAAREGVARAACTVADLQASLDALTLRCTQLTVDGVTHFAPGDDPPCGYCTYERACRERPADGERIFAR
jgi:RecB family exonuclease